METHEIYELIEARRKELNLSQSQLGMLALGQDNSSVIQAIKRGSSPSAHKLEAICNALGLEFYVGRKRSEGEPQFTSNHERVEVLQDFAFVERFDVSLSAGPGASGENAKKLAPVAFRRDWMLEKGLVAEKCVVCSVRGNSMEPMLFDGDLVLLDRRQTDVRDGQIYGVVDIEGDTKIKRIEMIDNGLLLRSENPECRTELRHGDDANRVQIIGSLAWSGHSYDTSRQAPSPQTPRRRTMKHDWI